MCNIDSKVAIYNLAMNNKVFVYNHQFSVQLHAFTVDINRNNFILVH